MVQVQALEKLHTACDECRTRKLRCSGDTPTCVRCQREKIACVYSPQKQMGRPRKRRREGEADDPMALPTEEHNEHANIMNDFSTITGFPELGLLSPPSLQDNQSSNGSTGPDGLTPHHEFVLHDQFGSASATDIDPSLDPAVDPSFWNLQPTQGLDFSNMQSDNANMDQCTCLSVTYLTLTELQSVPTFSFPQVTIPLRKAMTSLSDVIHCTICPKDPFSAIQNIQSVVSLFKAIVERFNKVLTGVDREATQLQSAGQKKPYRIGDNNPALYHLHTGTLDCPMGFNIEIEAADWRRLVKTALKAEVYGGGSNPRPLMNLMRESEARQNRWHESKSAWTEEMKHLHPGVHECEKAESCEALNADHIRRAIDNLKWD